MIKAINYGLAVSDEGFRVKVDRNHVSYVEGDYAVRIPCEHFSSQPSVICYFDHIQGWFPPHHRELITVEAKERIMQRIAACLEILFSQGGFKCRTHREHNQIVAFIHPLSILERMKKSQHELKEQRRKLPD